MPRSANEVMQSVIFSAVLEAIEGLRAASKGLPNQMVRDLQSIHRNTTFADLPKEVQDAIAASTRAAFTQLLKDGYAVAPPQQGQRSQPLDRVPERQRPPQGRGGERASPRGPGRGPRPGGRPGGGGARGPGGGGPRGGPGGGKPRG